MTAATVEKTPQQTISRLSKRKKGFTSVELAKERGKPGNQCGPFTRSIKAAVDKGAIIATSKKRNGKVIYMKNPNAPKKKRKVTKKASKPKKTVARKRGTRVITTDVKTPSAIRDTFKALGRNPNAANLLGDFFDSLAGICRGLA